MDKYEFEGRVNLVHWLDGYRGTDLKSSPAFFFAHLMIGIRVCFMVVFTLINSSGGSKYGYVVFSFPTALGLHSIPACLTQSTAFARIAFTSKCSYIASASFLDFRTLKLYHHNAVKYERQLAIECYAVAFGA